MKAPSTPSPVRHRDLLLLVPLLAAIVFVQIFASPLPLTDEWNYTHAIRRMHDLDFSTLAGWTDALRAYPATFREHVVAAPFLLYWPIAECTNFDSRWIIGLSIAAFATQAWLFRRRLLPSVWYALPLVLLLFCPSHYMEFLWAWQITLSCSVVLTLVALVLLDGISEQTGENARTWRLLGALLCLLLGTFSSASGFFGFPAALALLMAKRLPWRAKLSSLVVLAAVATWVYFAMLRGTTQPRPPGAREAWYVLTAFGATLWGSPVGLGSFGLDARSAGGLALAAGTLAVAVIAVQRRLLATVALPLSFALYGWLCMVPIALVRPYLGNWHIQCALPAVCGAYAAAAVLRQRDRSVYSAMLFFGLAALLTSCLYGYIAGFAHYGPAYRDYTRTIEQHVVRNLVEPGRPPPYPPQGSRDLDARLLLFLSAHRHPLFTDPEGPATPGLPAAAQVFIGGTAAPAPWVLAPRPAVPTLVTVVLPEADAPTCIRLSHGATVLILRRVHHWHVPAQIPRTPGTAFYMGMIVPHRFPSGEGELQFAVIR